jgi:hypothetical protein
MIHGRTAGQTICWRKPRYSCYSRGSRKGEIGNHKNHNGVGEEKRHTNNIRFAVARLLLPGLEGLCFRSETRDPLRSIYPPMTFFA